MNGECSPPFAPCLWLTLIELSYCLKSFCGISFRNSSPPKVKKTYDKTLVPLESNLHEAMSHQCNYSLLNCLTCSGKIQKLATLREPIPGPRNHGSATVNKSERKKAEMKNVNMFFLSDDD